jgi:hypothetical protein
MNKKDGNVIEIAEKPKDQKIEHHEPKHLENIF